MPFTPFHLGPGAVFKSIGDKHFSFMVFSGSQVLMDVEPLIGIIKNWPVLHGYTHTIPGATLIGILAGLSGKPISTFVLKHLRIPDFCISWRTSFISAYVGTFSHIVLDAVMHHDIRPFWPLTNSNPLLGIIPLRELHVWCVVLSAIGFIVWLIRNMKGRERF